MLAFRADLHGIEETITRNVLITVVSDVKELLGMTHDVYTVFDEKDNIVKKKNSLGDVKGHNTFKEDMFNIEFTETTEEGHEMSLVPFRPDAKHIYHDKEISSSITPIYLSKKLEVKIKYSNKSKSKIFSLTNKLKIFNSDNSIYRRHELEYHYTIPPFLIKLLAHINNLKNIRIPAEDKLALEQYIDQTFDDRVDFTNTLDADITKSQLVIREAQLEVEGYVVDDVHGLTPEYDESFNTWYVEFTYGFSYEKPVSLLTQYPLLVFNTPIDKEFRTFIETYKYRKNSKVTAGRGDMVDVTTRDDVFNIRDNSYYIRIPKYDNELLPKPGSSLARMFSVLSVVDELNLIQLFNINHIPKIKFKENALKFLLESEYKYVGNQFESLFFIELFKDGKRDYNNRVLMDNLGNLITEREMDIRSIYRVVFNIVTDTVMLKREAALRFKRFCQDQLLDKDNIKPSPTFQESYSYWAGVDYRKFNQEVTTDNLVTDYLTLLSLDASTINNAIVGTSKFYEIPFAIATSKTSSSTKNVIIKNNLLSILERK